MPAALEPADNRINKNTVNCKSTRARARASPSVDLSYLTRAPIKITYSYAVPYVALARR